MQSSQILSYCELRELVISRDPRRHHHDHRHRGRDYVTIISRARMGYESLAHEAEGRMGY